MLIFWMELEWGLNPLTLHLIDTFLHPQQWPACSIYGGLIYHWAVCEYLFINAEIRHMWTNMSNANYEWIASWVRAHKGQWRGAWMFSLICVWINGWVNNDEAGVLRRYRAHYGVIVMTEENYHYPYISFYHVAYLSSYPGYFRGPHWFPLIGSWKYPG